jgi:hypothetical protein
MGQRLSPDLSARFAAYAGARSARKGLRRISNAGTVVRAEVRQAESGMWLLCAVHGVG